MSAIKVQTCIQSDIGHMGKAGPCHFKYQMLRPNNCSSLAYFFLVVNWAMCVFVKALVKALRGIKRPCESLSERRGDRFFLFCGSCAGASACDVLFSFIRSDLDF